MERKQHTPSVIARLMGLDELPPQQPIRKQQRVLSDNYHRKTASIGLREKRSFYEGCSFRVRVEKQQEFKDVFEVPEVPKINKNQICSVPEGKTNSSETEAEMGFIRQKFINAKNLSMDEKLQRLKEFGDVLEDLDSDNLSVRCLQQPDMLFTKHLHDLNDIQPDSLPGHMTVLKSSRIPNDKNNERSTKPEKTAREKILRSLQKLDNDSVTDFFEDLNKDCSHKLLKSRLELKDETCLPPTRIVVLKPNFEKAKNAAKSSFSPSSLGSQSADGKHKEFPKSKNGELYNQTMESKNMGNDMVLSRNSFRMSGGIAKETTRQIRHRDGNSASKVSGTEFRVNDKCVNESDIMMPSCPNFFDGTNQNPTSYSSNLVSEAKKRLSERWKMTKSFQEVEVVNRSCTLGKMLAMPDQEKGPTVLNFKLDKDSQHSQFSFNGGNADLSSPLGISSKDGWKDKHFGNSPNSRPLPALHTAYGTLKFRSRKSCFDNGWSIRLGEAITAEENKFRKQNFSKKDISKPRESRLSNENSPLSSRMHVEKNHAIQGSHGSLAELENKLEEEDLVGKKSVISKLSSCSAPCSDLDYNHRVLRTQLIPDKLENSFRDNDMSESSYNSAFLNSSICHLDSGSMIADIVADAETKNVGISSGIHREQQPEPAADFLLVKDGHSSSHVGDASTRQESFIGSSKEGLVPSNCIKIDSEFPLSSEDAYQPSPNSVLELPFKEEISSGSEFFNSANTDLHDLQMQLQLLESELGDTHSEGSGMAVSSDEDCGEGSFDFSEGNRKLMGLFRAEESRDFSYLVDVLDEASFHGGNWEMCFRTEHSADRPLSLLVFDALEKKYGKQKSWEKSERRLLFDRINSGLMEILQPCMDIHMWAKPLRMRLSATLRRNVVEEELWMLLVIQEKDVSMDLSKNALGKEMRWLELGDDIDVIAREIERFLFDELVEELVIVECL